MPLRYEEVADLIRIIDGSGCEELILETAELKLVLRRNGAASRAAAPPLESRAPTPSPAQLHGQPQAQPTAPQPSAEPDEGGGEAVVRAPMVGTFYRSPSPEAPPFVEVGGVVEAGQPLCLIEVMKLFTTIYAERAGRIARIVPENGTLVEYGQALFVLAPD